MIGDKHYTEAMDCAFMRSGRGALFVPRSVKVTDRGAQTSEDADISNVKGSEILPRRKPKVSWATIFVPGLVGT